MKHIAWRCLMLLTLAATPAFAQAPADTSKPSFEATSTSTRYATLLKVDTTARVITYRSQEGDTVVLPVKPEVKTLGKLKRGDKIKAVSTETLSIHVEEGTNTELSIERMRGDAKPGDKPSVTLTERATYRATISAIDLAANTATLKDPTGDESVVTPRDPENLKRVKVGDIVVITATQITAMSVDKTTPKKPAAKPAAKK